MSEVKSIESGFVPAYQDRAWHWVKYDDAEAPAMYLANVDCWYSYQFGGIPTRQLEVLGPCSLLAGQAQEIERLNALLSRDPNVIVTELRQTRLSIDTPNQYKQDLIDCIIGAMAFGFQNTNPPPEGHWGKQFWDIGREEGNRQAELEAELSQLKSRQSGVVLPDALSDAFITCKSGNGEYRVVIKSETLKEVQQIHNWLVRLNSSAVSSGCTAHE